MDEKEQKQLLMDLDVVMRSNECQYIVQFYGALFKEVRFVHNYRATAKVNYTYTVLILILAFSKTKYISFLQGDCWICMEVMSISLDKFYKYIYGPLQELIPECIIGKITLATVKALSYLKEKLCIIHRG